MQQQYNIQLFFTVCFLNVKTKKIVPFYLFTYLLILSNKNKNDGKAQNVKKSDAGSRVSGKHDKIHYVYSFSPLLDQQDCRNKSITQH